MICFFLLYLSIYFMFYGMKVWWHCQLAKWRFEKEIVLYHQMIYAWKVHLHPFSYSFYFLSIWHWTSSNKVIWCRMITYQEMCISFICDNLGLILFYLKLIVPVIDETILQWTTISVLLFNWWNYTFYLHQ